jgi:hypothetical protein
VVKANGWFDKLQCTYFWGYRSWSQKQSIEGLIFFCAVKANGHFKFSVFNISRKCLHVELVFEQWSPLDIEW